MAHGTVAETPNSSIGAALISNSSGPNAYGLRVKGDSMHPAIRDGWFVVVEPGRQCVPGEYVVVGLIDGRKMVKELVSEGPDQVVIEAVNGNQRTTLKRVDIETMHAVTQVMSARHWTAACAA